MTSTVVLNSQVAAPGQAGGFRISSFFAALILFAALNWIYSFKTDASPVLDRIKRAVNPIPIDKTFAAWTARAWVNQKQPPQVVLLGSSQVASAIFTSEAELIGAVIDCAEHREVQAVAAPLSIMLGHAVHVFNWSQSGAMVSDDYLITSYLFNGSLKPQVVVLGVSPRDFIDNTLPCAGSTESFRFFTTCSNLGTHVAAADAFPDFMSRVGWTIDSLPFQSIKQDLKLFVHQQSLANLQPLAARTSTVSVYDDLVHVEPGKWRVPPHLPRTYSNNTVEYLRRYKNPNPAGYTFQRIVFDRLLGTLHKRDIAVLIIGMPSLAVNRDLLPAQFWNYWRRYIAGECTKYGSRWVDLSDSKEFTKEDYLDTVHLNANGGKKLLDLITQTLMADPVIHAHLEQHKNIATKI